MYMYKCMYTCMYTSIYNERAPRARLRVCEEPSRHAPTCLHPRIQASTHAGRQAGTRACARASLGAGACTRAHSLTAESARTGVAAQCVRAYTHGFSRRKVEGAKPRTYCFADGHTASNAPDLFRPPKLSGAGPG